MSITPRKYSTGELLKFLFYDVFPCFFTPSEANKIFSCKVDPVKKKVVATAFRFDQLFSFLFFLFLTEREGGS